MTCPKLSLLLPGLKEGWELAPQYFCTPLPCWKKHARAFFDRNTQKKVSFFMSRRNAWYRTEEIAPPVKKVNVQLSYFQNWWDACAVPQIY